MKRAAVIAALCLPVAAAGVVSDAAPLAANVRMMQGRSTSTALRKKGAWK